MRWICPCHQRMPKATPITTAQTAICIQLLFTVNLSACRPAHADWRRGRDSNPRWAFTHSGFQDRRNRPLCHLSDRRLACRAVARTFLSQTAFRLAEAGTAGQSAIGEVAEWSIAAVLKTAVG